MAHFARLNETNEVIQVHVLNNDVILDGDGVEQEQLGIDFLTELYGAGNYKQTSYNNNFRKQYAGVGYTYDETRNAFIPPKPYASWTLNESTCQWNPPTPHPDDGKFYIWNETEQRWDEIT